MNTQLSEEMIAGIEVETTRAFPVIRLLGWLHKQELPGRRSLPPAAD